MSLAVQLPDRTAAETAHHRFAGADESVLSLGQSVAQSLGHEAVVQCEFVAQGHACTAPFTPYLLPIQLPTHKASHA